MAKDYTNSLKIRRLPYSRLLKTETADYSEQVIAIIEEHKPKSAFINQLFGLLQKKKADIHLLRLNYGVDTERLKAKHQKGTMLLKISMLKLKSKMLADFVLEQEFLILNNAIKSFLCNLHKCKNDKVLNQKVAGFLDRVANNDKLAQAIGKYGLNGEFDEVSDAHKLFNSIVKRRIKLLSERPKVSSRAISKDLLQRMDNLFQGVELAYVISKETSVGEGVDSAEDLALLINRLDQLSEMYYKSAKLRELNNKRKASIEDGVDYEDIATVDQSSNEADQELYNEYTPEVNDDVSAISVEVGDSQAVEKNVRALSKPLEAMVISNTDKLLLRKNTDKEVVKRLCDRSLNSEGLNTELIDASSG